ncbi:MAG: enoyl-CoA hydratase/isomerase family protein [Acidobacteria bacterium]|nr:enoyl-CoA hydratase/isomerase family protein [Acidobacteriota bacterium]MBV9070670.1 enoyl-CoA hydratase/isomerase family protein [Acidobacteriota bacterium]MBV9478143.1 enoyl-CoA hydratase/isomerase family protein [Acidobacteriota bacterium]
MIERTDADSIATLRLAHGKASAMDIELVDGIARAFAEVAADESIRVAILTGTGSIFSAGVDLFRLTDGGRAYAEQFVPALSRMLLEVFALPKPLVVAANGHAIAGGCILTLAGDYRLMAQGNGRIGMPELLVGVPFPPSVLEAVRFVVPPQHLQALIYSGRTLPPDDALRVGLVDEVVAIDELPARASAVARQLASVPAQAFAATKRQLRDAAISRAKHYAAEFDGDVRELWSAPETHAHIRDYLARTVKK